jgi:hypothetical protein
LTAGGDGKTQQEETQQQVVRQEAEQQQESKSKRAKAREQQQESKSKRATARELLQESNCDDEQLQRYTGGAPNGRCRCFCFDSIIRVQRWMYGMVGEGWPP